MTTTGLAQEVKTRPIIFGAESVRAILEGRKTQTRRVMKPQPWYEPGSFPPGVELLWWRWSAYAASASHDPPGVPSEQWFEHCPYGKPGERLWVREAWDFAMGGAYSFDGYRSATYGLSYAAGGGRFLEYEGKSDDDPYFELADSRGGNRSPIFMPRWASRITLELTEVRVERLQEITEADAIAEGCTATSLHPHVSADEHESAREQYARVWDELNAKRGFGWNLNPWVWVLSFKRAL